MYKLSVPVMDNILSRGDNKEKTAADLKRMGADRVFLALDAYIADPTERKAALQSLREDCAYFKNLGFEVGSWCWTFMVREDFGFTRMKSPTGRESSMDVCPSDEAFCDYAADYIRELAATGVDLIMFDDDFRYGFQDMGLGCVCENHLARMREITGENFTLDDIRDHLLSGKKNKYRSAWIQANGEYLRGFARRMRAALDEVSPQTRMGFCACMSNWDFDGILAHEISLLLAGGTKPFMRLIGAPYWAAMQAWGNRLGDVIELERMERSWCPDGIEIFSEGDAYPRPRFCTPAAIMEGFDTALRADGSLDGILKYGLDYSASPDYERGYVERHCKHLPLYAGIDDFFGSKTPCGIRIYEFPKKYENADVPEEKAGKDDVQDMFFSPASRLTSACSLPTVYHGTGVGGIAFGENARYLDEDALNSGLVLDLLAARILTERGVDVGLLAVGEKHSAATEHFSEPEEYVSVDGSYYETTLAPGARVQSEFTEGDTAHPASYLYENSRKQRFLVFTFNAYFNGGRLNRQYGRSRQLAEAFPYLSGQKLPAFCFGNPDLYTLCKSENSKLTVGLWNFFPDEIDAPVITLHRPYTAIRFLNCEGELHGDCVTLTPIPAYGFAAFEVYDK